MTLNLLWPIFILPLSISALISFLLGPLVIKLYKRYRWLEDPAKANHQKVIHTYPVPRGGGLVVFGALIIGILLFIGLDKHSVGIVVGALILAITGFVDDIRDINPYMRLFLGFLAGAAVVAAGIGIAYITHPFAEGVLQLNQPQIAFWLFGKVRTIWVFADLFAIVWIVWTMNMMNWSKGLDGQLPGVVVIAACIIGILSLRFTQDVTQWDVTKLAAITAGAYAGLLYWNKYPQKMMPGYGAGSLAGYLLAVLSILSGAKLATLILVLGIPMIDAVYVILRRLYNGKSPVWGDRSHFHHQLLDRGWSKPQVALFYWFITLMLGIIALYLNPQLKLFTIIVLTLSFGGLLIWLRYLTTYSKPRAPGNGLRT